MPARYLNNTLLECTTPDTTGWLTNDEMSVDAIVEISLNDQQFTGQNALVFTFFVDPIITRAEQFSTDNKLVHNGGEPLTVYGKKLRKENDLKCVHRTQSDLCKDTNCTDGVFVSSLYLRSEKMYCSAPSFPGQAPSQSGLVGADKSVLLLAVNGYTLGLDEVEFRYWTPLDTEAQVLYSMLGMFVFAVLLFFCFIQYKRRAMKNRKVISVSEEWKRPSIDAADEHRHQVGIRKYGTRKYDFRKTKCEKLGELGEGIGLYFQFLKYFGQTFTLMAIIAIPAMVLNTSGVAYSSKKIDPNPILKSTVGNIGSTEDGTENLVILSMQQFDLYIDVPKHLVSFIVSALDSGAVLAQHRLSLVLALYLKLTPLTSVPIPSRHLIPFLTCYHLQVSSSSSG
jgi:hypothetical protein